MELRKDLMPPETEPTRIRELLEKIDAVTAESKRLRERIERVRGQALQWPESSDAETFDGPPGVSDKKTQR